MLDLLNERGGRGIFWRRSIIAMKSANISNRRHAQARKREDHLYAAILALQSPEECRAFFKDLCTPAEIEAMRDRWEVTRLLSAGESYRQIAEKTGISLTTITRVARCLRAFQSGYQRILNRLQSEPKGRVFRGTRLSGKSSKE